VWIQISPLLSSDVTSTKGGQHLMVHHLCPIPSRECLSCLVTSSHRHASELQLANKLRTEWERHEDEFTRVSSMCFPWRRTRSSVRNSSYLVS
jgi:hypothetical protein